MPDLTSAQHMRCVALEAASRCVEPDTPTSGLLSRAFQCETYLVSGLVRTGPKWLGAAEVGADGVSVMVETPNLTEVQATRIGDAVKAILAPAAETGDGTGNRLWDTNTNRWDTPQETTSRLGRTL